MIVWTPADPASDILGISGLPSHVTVQGPDENGNWKAIYFASAVPSVWSYTVTVRTPAAGGTSADFVKVRTGNDMSKDPEIDNTPPPQT